MNTNENGLTEITLVLFEETGQSTEVKQIDVTDPNFSRPLLEQLGSRLKHLSGDLDLPLEAYLPVQQEEIAFRISSDHQNSFAFYYLGSEIIGLSLTLTGGDPVPEAEMIDSIRLLLIDQEDREELDDEEIESILAAEDFEFQKFEQRPIHFFVPLTSEIEETLEELIQGSLHLAVVLCQTQNQ